MASMKNTIDKANKTYHFELFNNIVNNFSGKDFTTDELMNEFFGLKNYTPKVATKKKDPNQPKRAQSAYFIFSNEKRPAIMEKLKKENGKIDVTIVSKQLGAMWKDLSSKKRKPYDDKALEDKIRYEKAMAEYKLETDTKDAVNNEDE